MSKLGFCARCWNYVDFCDCINYEYDLEFENEKVIPPPPPEKQPEVGTVWYFVGAIRPLALGLEAANGDKVGLAVLLSMENLWTINPPPGDPSQWLSIPVDRLEKAPIQLGTFNEYIMPWEQNYFNFNPNLWDQAKTLAQDVQSCKQKFKIVAKICKGIKFVKSFFESWDGDEMPIPPELIDKLSLITGYVDPALLVTLISFYFPPAVLEGLNDATLTAIDYDWVHRHLVDTLDPDEGYQDKEQPYGTGILQGDWLNDDGSYPFPSPSESIKQGGGNPGPVGIKGQTFPDADQLMGVKSRRPWITCKRGVCKLSKYQYRDKNGKPFRDANGNPIQDPRPKPIFDDILLYESDDDEIPKSRPTLVPSLPNPPNKDVVARVPPAYPFRNDNAATVQYPTLFQVLTNVGENQTQFLDYPCCETTVVNENVIQTVLNTQASVGSTQFTFVTAAGGGQNGAASRTFRFTRLSGTDDSLIFEQGGVTTTLVAVGGVINYVVTFFTTINDVVHFMYRHVKIRGVLSTGTVWEVSQPSGVTGIFVGTVPRVQLHRMQTVQITPATINPGNFTVEGYLTQFNINPGITYTGKSISCNPALQVPIMLQVRNEINMIAYAPNTFVTPTTSGYCVGRSGGVGGIGTPYLPFDPVGVNTVVTYALDIRRSQGQSFVTGNLTYNL